MKEFRPSYEWKMRQERYIWTGMAVIVAVPILAVCAWLGAIWPEPRVPYTYTEADFTIMCESQLGDILYLGDGKRRQRVTVNHGGECK